MSFQLVDRIHSLTPGVRATGELRIPSYPCDFPLALVVEAIGQLAGYVAMERHDFTLRPVAALAGEVLATGEMRPGDLLNLEIEVRALRANAMRYGGRAHVAGGAAVELNRCTGALLPMETFDDPARVRAQLCALREAGAPTRAFPERAEFASQIDLLADDDPQCLRATLKTPLDAPFYADHFPERAVYPATLLLDSKIEVARQLVSRCEPARDRDWAIRAVRNVKVRSFTPPGGQIDLVVHRSPEKDEDGARAIRMEASSEGEIVSTAFVWLEPRPHR